VKEGAKLDNLFMAHVSPLYKLWTFSNYVGSSAFSNVVIDRVREVLLQPGTQHLEDNLLKMVWSLQRKKATSGRCSFVCPWRSACWTG